MCPNFSSWQAKKIPVSVMVAHMLVSGVFFEWSPVFQCYMPRDEGSQDEMYAYLGYIAKIKAHLQDLGLWDRLCVCVCVCVLLCSTRASACVCVRALWLRMTGISGLVMRFMVHAAVF